MASLTAIRAARRAIHRSGRTAARDLRRYSRRTTAVILALVFFGFSAETLVADVHDGDATAGELAAFGGAHADEPPVRLADTAPDAPPGSPEQRTEQDGHAYHSCHCAHAHGGAPPHAAPIGASVHASLSPPGESDRVPASAALEPGLRPPIL